MPLILPQLTSGTRSVILRKRNSIKGNADLDTGLYRYRDLVQNTFSGVLA